VVSLGVCSTSDPTSFSLCEEPRRNRLTTSKLRWADEHTEFGLLKSFIQQHPHRTGRPHRQNAAQQLFCLTSRKPPVTLLMRGRRGEAMLGTSIPMPNRTIARAGSQAIFATYTHRLRVVMRFLKV
jgi:hypothetical protein